MPSPARLVPASAAGCHYKTLPHVACHSPKSTEPSSIAPDIFNWMSTAMERLLTSLVFCEAPLDPFAYGGAPPASTGAATRLAADVPSSRTAEGADAEARGHVIRRPPRLWQAKCAPAFDGLCCFETVVMPARPSSKC
ncbi:hypothetical protein HU200_003946 [Digitaria exilis]|uniref:Uncharacterized protein n=1 Tax=Digitaria exilis TaxID=1010633 RepID=A0A835KJB1_9POAL|nr:hypothetical protein HU200_015101 [Digitaria exilis]KAF8776039.1 hypothetical protein HU200_003946 [Digitaria exilis]